MKSNVVNPWRDAKDPAWRGTTGRIFETEVLGECLLRARGWMEFHRAVKAVRWAQPHDPYRPVGERQRFNQAVKAEMQALGMQVDALGLFSAVGSPLDRHGVDGFFSFHGIMVTVDCTINPHKDTTDSCVLVTGADADNGFREAANEIAFWFKWAEKNGKKGVI